MANEQNLRPFTSDQNREEAAKNGRKGGKASGEARRRRKAMREAFEELLSRNFTNTSGESMQGVEIVTAKVFQQAMDGDLKAAQFIRDTVGEAPTQQVEVSQIPKETYDRVADILGEA